jgi:hypothetical protein
VGARAAATAPARVAPSRADGPPCTCLAVTRAQGALCAPRPPPHPRPPAQATTTTRRRCWPARCTRWRAPGRLPSTCPPPTAGWTTSWRRTRGSSPRCSGTCRWAWGGRGAGGRGGGGVGGRGAWGAWGAGGLEGWGPGGA